MLKCSKSAIAGILVAATMTAGSIAAVSPASAGGNSWHHGNWNRGNWNHGSWHYPNNYWVGPAIGFGTGLVFGSILAQPRYYGPAYAPRYGNNRDAYCHARFRSYNSYTHTYLGYDGHRHYC